MLAWCNRINTDWELKAPCSRSNSENTQSGEKSRVSLGLLCHFGEITSQGVYWLRQSPRESRRRFEVDGWSWTILHQSEECMLYGSGHSLGTQITNEGLSACCPNDINVYTLRVHTAYGSVAGNKTKRIRRMLAKPFGSQTLNYLGGFRQVLISGAL